MKKILLILTIILMTLTVSAQETTDADTLWKFSGTTSLSLSQLSLTN